MIIHPRAYGGLFDWGASPAFTNVALQAGAAGGSKWSQGAWAYLFNPTGAAPGATTGGLTPNMKLALVGLGALLVLALLLGGDSKSGVVILK